jgi:hypothetical protein
MKGRGGNGRGLYPARFGEENEAGEVRERRGGGEARRWSSGKKIGSPWRRPGAAPARPVDGEVEGDVCAAIPGTSLARGRRERRRGAHLAPAMASR